MILEGLVGICLAGAFIFLAENVREQRYFKITSYTIRTAGLNGLDGPKKIIFLSDLHNKEYGPDNEKLIRAIKAAKPDLILAGGDMPVSKKGISTRPAAQLMKHLPAIAPVYYVNGNHEQRMKEKPKEYGNTYVRYKKELTDAGVQFLSNTSAVFTWGEASVRLWGLEIPSADYETYARKPLPLAEIKKRLGKPEADAFHILMAHNPAFFETYQKWGANLVLSGHLHGGIVRIPGIGGIISPQARLFPKYSGELKEKDGAYIAVSKGLGTHTVNLRFCNPAELVVLTLEGEK